MTVNKFSINALIQKGKEIVKEYDLNGMKIFVRPITDFEMSEAEARLFDDMPEEEIKKYMDADEDATIPGNVSILMRANSNINVYIAYCAMKDFVEEEDFCEDMVKEINGIAKLAEYVREISGYGVDAAKQVKEFRKDTEGQ